MYRLNVKITEEALTILKTEVKRIGSSMGTVITLWALEKQKESLVLTTMETYKQQQILDSQSQIQPPKE